MRTTVIGSYPLKTDVPTWFSCTTAHSTGDYSEYVKNRT